jgi:cobalt-zinc-cadmium efflux system outer membrane protein
MQLSHPIRSTHSITTARSRIVAAGVLVLSIAPSSIASGAPSLDEVSGARQVCVAGPAASLARAERLKGAAAVVTAGVLPNPEIVIEHRRSLSGPNERETTVGLSVPIGLGGRRFLLQDAAEARRRQAQADAHLTLFEAALGFREAFGAAVLDEARLAVVSEQQRALDALTATIQALAKSGESAGYSLLRQETQARLHRRLVESMKARAAASRATLEAWTGEEVTLPPVALADVAGGSQAQGSRPPSSEEHPRVASLESASQASSIEARAARRRWVPEVALFAGYRTITGVGAETGHGIALGLTVPLTFFDHGQGEAARAEAEQAIAKASADVVKRENASLGKASALKLQILEASVADLDRAVTEAASLQTKAATLYAAGEVSITELLDAFRAVEEARLARIDLAEEIARARLARMRAGGTLFNATLDKECGSISGGTP